MTHPATSYHNDVDHCSCWVFLKMTGVISDLFHKKTPHFNNITTCIDYLPYHTLPYINLFIRNICKHFLWLVKINVKLFGHKKKCLTTDILWSQYQWIWNVTGVLKPVLCFWEHLVHFFFGGGGIFTVIIVVTEILRSWGLFCSFILEDGLVQENAASVQTCSFCLISDRKQRYWLQCIYTCTVY